MIETGSVGNPGINEANSALEATLAVVYRRVIRSELRLVASTSRKEVIGMVGH